MLFFSRPSSKKPASKSRCHAQRKSKAYASNRRRLRLEALEDRLLLSPYIVTTTADSGPGSLPDAITQVNADTFNVLYPSPSNPNVDEIDFNITAAFDTGGGYNAATGVATIAPLSALPQITRAVLINGYSQPGSSENTLTNGDNAVLRIVLNGRNVPGTDYFASAGLVISANGITVEGLAINSFGGSDIFATGNNDNFQGNFIGTDVSGTFTPFVPNLAQNGAVDHAGIYINGSFNVIGTNGDGMNDPAERNVIAGNNYGVVLRTTTNSVVAGNFIGTDVSGTHALANWVGITTLVNAIGDRIGTNGTDADVAGERNIISGNAAGIAFGAGLPGPAETGGMVAGNWIGLDVNGNPLGNTRAGIFVGVSSSAITIGGSQAVLANTIANTQGEGVGVWILSFLGSPTGIRVQGNSIHDNRGLGIDIGGGFPIPGPDGVNSNSSNDAANHVGPNNLENFPVLNSAISSSSDTSITGNLSSGTAYGTPYLPNSTFTLDFYANSTEDPSGHGQGQIYLGSAQVTTDASGNAPISVDVGTGNLAADWITATATDPSGNTSEFSADIQATAAPAGQTYNGPYLQSLLPQSSTTSNALSIQTGPNLTQATVISAVNSLTAPSQPVTITLNLNGGTYNDTTVSPPANVTLVINGASGTNTFVGHSPAFTVTGGNVIVENVSFTTATDSPTILVTGGSLTLRNDTIQESTGGSKACIALTGGTVDLGTTASPGGNTLNINGPGAFVHNTGPNPVMAVGDTFELDGMVITSAAQIAYLMNPVTTTTLTASANPSLLAQSVSFTATVGSSSPAFATGTPSGAVQFQIDGLNIGSPLVLSGGSARISTASLAVGPHTVTALYSGDGNFLASTGSLSQSVDYGFSGFLAPLNQSMAFALNRTIPIKFQLTNFNSTLITSLSAVASLQVAPVQSSGGLGTPFNPTPAGGTVLRNDGTQYSFNWQTKGLSAGTYEILLTLADGTVQTRVLQLTKGGSSAGLTTVAAGGTTAAPGGLLGGNIELYVDNSNGDLNADELARVQDAVTAVDAVTAPYGVAVAEVTDPTLADVTLNMGTTSAVGGYANGVLGCTTDAGQITIISGWNFYAGSNATAIGAGQYDFQTVVTHELGHALGLGHSANSASVMFATLNAGTANRALATADLNVPDRDTGGACGLHTASVSGAGVEFFGAGLSGGASSTISGFQEQGDSLSTMQAALSAVLADWNSTTDFGGQIAHILDDGASKRSFNRVASRTINEQDEFWSNTAGTTELDKIITLSGGLAQP